MTMVADWWNQSEFSKYRSYLRVRNKRGVELRVPEELVPGASALVVTCVACGAPIHCFRLRQAPAKRSEATGTMYVSVSCPSLVRSGCSRGKAASDALDQIKALVGF